MSALEIVIWGDSKPCIEEFNFHDSITKETRKLVRGRVAPHNGGASFHFTAALHAFVILAFRHAANPNSSAVLVGNGTSPALSLEYAILRKPSWIQDLFGVDSHGNAMVLRYFRRVNAGLKRAAPLKVSLNSSLLAPHDITCSTNGRRISLSEDFTLLADYFEALWLERSEARPTGIPHSGESAC